MIFICSGFECRPKKDRILFGFSDHQQRGVFSKEEAPIFAQKEKESSGEPLNVLKSSGQETLLVHVVNAGHTSKAKAVIFFGLSKGAFNGFFTPSVESFAVRRFGNESNLIKDFISEFEMEVSSLNIPC